MHHLVLFLHVLAATIWTGGHLVLLTVVLPGVSFLGGLLQALL